MHISYKRHPPIQRILRLLRQTQQIIVLQIVYTYKSVHKKTCIYEGFLILYERAQFIFSKYNIFAEIN